MTENDVVEILHKFIAKKFLLVCFICGYRYQTLADFLRYTNHVGKPVSYDAEMGNWRPFKPLGAFFMANCSCDTTISINSDGMSLIIMLRMLHWAKKESAKRSISVKELLEGIRNKIDQLELDQADSE
ncbi:hypothetical protein ACFL5P_04270 [candidate division KSB1 bacterium]